MQPQTKDNESPGMKLWKKIEALQSKLEMACDAFDELYAYVHNLKNSHQSQKPKRRH